MSSEAQFYTLVGGIILALITALPGLLDWFSRQRKARIEAKKDAAQVERDESEASASDAAAAFSYAQASEIVSKRNVELLSRVDALERLVEENRVLFQNQVSENQRIIQEQQARIAELTDWADRLAHQVISLGGVPVPMRKRAVDDIPTGPIPGTGRSDPPVSDTP